MKCPCRGCEQAGCGAYHDTCPKFKEWRQEIDKRNHKRNVEKSSRELNRDHEMKYRRNLKRK